MLLAERETTIRWDAEEKIAKIWTNDPMTIKRMDTLCEHKSGAYQCMDKLGQSATYRADAKLICFRFPTEEEIAEKKRQNTKLRTCRKIVRRREG